MTKDGGPAFPVSDMHAASTLPGMSLRDWFAGHALLDAIRFGTRWHNDSMSAVWQRTQCYTYWLTR